MVTPTSSLRAARRLVCFELFDRYTDRCSYHSLPQMWRQTFDFLLYFLSHICCSCVPPSAPVRCLNAEMLPSVRATRKTHVPDVNLHEFALWSASLLALRLLYVWLTATPDHQKIQRPSSILNIWTFRRSLWLLYTVTIYIYSVHKRSVVVTGELRKRALPRRFPTSSHAEEVTGGWFI